MIFEKLDTKIDIPLLQQHVEQHVLGLTPHMVGPYFGGWSVLSSNGKYTDGWSSGQLLFDKNFRPDLTLKEKAELLGVKPGKMHINPTEICTGYLQTVMETIRNLGLQPYRARLSLLKAQGSSTLHRDAPDNVYSIRLHVPIITNSDCTFECDEGAAHMAADGSMYVIRVNRMHQVFNRGATDRIHLIMDVNDTVGATKHHRQPQTELTI